MPLPSEKGTSEKGPRTFVLEMAAGKARIWPFIQGYPGEQNKTLFKGFVRPLSGLHVLIAIQTLVKPCYSVRLDNFVWLTVVSVPNCSTAAC